MCKLEKAKGVAQIYLDGLGSKINMPLVIVEVKEQEFGCVFFYNSKEYIETGKLSSMLAGNSPFIVDYDEMKVHILGTSQPLDFYISEYLKGNL